MRRADTHWAVLGPEVVPVLQLENLDRTKRRSRL